LIFKEALIALAKEFGSDGILLPVHDAVLFQFPEENHTQNTARAVEVLKDAFARRCPGVVPKVTVGDFAH
jgi:DNA polymerase I